MEGFNLKTNHHIRYSFFFFRGLRQKSNILLTTEFKTSELVERFVEKNFERFAEKVSVLLSLV